jgi:hypothetical protein
MKQDAAKEQVVATVLEKKVSDEQLKQQIIQPRNNRAQKVFAGDHNKTLNKEHGRH